MLVFTILGTATPRITRFVPHISIETVSASAILFGYVWGWKIGLIFGFGAGMFGTIYNGFLKLTTMVNAMFMGVCGIFGAIFASLGFSFWWAFLLTYIVRANLGFFVFQLIKPDLLENVIHSYGDALFNVLIVSQIMAAIYRLILPIA